MENSIKFIKGNVWLILIGLVIYASFLMFTYSGNRMCDCETTEKYHPNQGRHNSVNRFYHK